MSRAYLNKDYCKQTAESYHQGKWTNVTVEQLTKEIYGHAYAYYNITPTIAKFGALFGLGTVIWAQSVFPHLDNGIDIEDKVDKYQWAWEAIWEF